MLNWIFLNALFIWYSDGLVCDLQNMKINCTNIEKEDLYSDITVILNPEEVLDLNIMNASISSIDGGMFSKFKFMHTLCLENIQLKNITKDTFVNLSFLRNLYLRHNLLENFNSNIFNDSNVLYSLDLSNNLIQNLDDFNITLFPLLTIMNISNNNIQTLSKEILNKLRYENDFHLIIDNNPWNCIKTDWLNNSNLVQAFCDEINMDNIQNDSNDTEVVLIEEPVQNVKYKGGQSTEKNLISLCGYETRCFSYCVFWFVGGIWIGVILGNAGKIKKLVCGPSESFMQEQNTQYERGHLRSKE